MQKRSPHACVVYVVCFAAHFLSNFTARWVSAGASPVWFPHCPLCHCLLLSWVGVIAPQGTFLLRVVVPLVCTYKRYETPLRVSVLKLSIVLHKVIFRLCIYIQPELPRQYEMGMAVLKEGRTAVDCIFHSNSLHFPFHFPSLCLWRSLVSSQSSCYGDMIVVLLSRLISLFIYRSRTLGSRNTKKGRRASSFLSAVSWKSLKGTEGQSISSIFPVELAIRQLVSARGRRNTLGPLNRKEIVPFRKRNVTPFVWFSMLEVFSSAFSLF